MLDFTEIMNGLDGNGMTETEVLAVSHDLAQFATLRDKLAGPLSGLYSPEQTREILLMIEPPTIQRQIMAGIFDNLSEREKECFLLYTVESKSMSTIAMQLSVSKGTVNAYIRRAREKMQLQS